MQRAPRGLALPSRSVESEPDQGGRAYTQTIISLARPRGTHTMARVGSCKVGRQTGSYCRLIGKMLEGNIGTTRLEASES